MAYWKPSFAGLSAFFEWESKQGMPTGNNGESTASLQTQGGEQRDSEYIRSSCITGEREELDAMIHDIWEDVFARVREYHPMIMEQLFLTTRSDTEKRLAVNVAREVFKREMIIAFENISESRREQDGEEGSAAEEVLQFIASEKNDLQSTCDEYKEKYGEMTKMFDTAREEIENLRVKNSSLENCTRLLKAEMEELREAKRDEEVKALRAQHDAEMAHLIAKQSVLQAQFLEKQLKEAEGSSKAVKTRMEELRKVQNELRSVVADNSRQSRIHNRRSPNDSPEHRDPKPLGHLGMALARRKSTIIGQKANEQVGPEMKNESSEVVSPTSTTDHFRTDASGDKITERRGLKTLRPKFTGQQESEEHRAGVGHEERGMFRKRFRSLRRGAHGISEAEASRELRSKLSGLTGFRRLLSLSRREGHQSGSARSSAVSAPQTLDALAKNLEVLQEMVHSKQEEVNRLHRELRRAKQQSDAFEQRLRKEQHKRVEMKYCFSSNASPSTEVDGIGAPSVVDDGESGVHK
ncbi:unnamed protein product [Agarophyton chilense]